MAEENLQSSDNESAHSSTTDKTDRTGRTQNMLVGVVGVLVIMAGIQVFQTQQLMAAVSSGSIKAGAGSQESSSIGLPSQVGGCG
jgi:hypothetical protein